MPCYLPHCRKYYIDSDSAVNVVLVPVSIDGFGHGILSLTKRETKPNCSECRRQTLSVSTTPDVATAGRRRGGVKAAGGNTADEDNDETSLVYPTTIYS